MNTGKFNRPYVLYTLTVPEHLDADNFIHAKKSISFSANPVHTFNCKTHRQDSSLSEANDQRTWVNTRTPQAAVKKIKHLVMSYC